VLERLADDLEERQALRAKLIGATLYPAIVSLIAVVIVIFLVTYVVPQVAQVFTSSKRALPALTVAMLAISGFLRSWGWLLLLAIAAGVGTLLLHAAQRGFPERFDAAWLTPAADRPLWRAATTRRASPARWRCWPAPACRSSRRCRRRPRRCPTAPCAPMRWMH
jgi:type II secretory pathway component PulF